MKNETQLVLFEDYFNKNEIWQANLLIKNLFNKNIEDLHIFKKYYEFSIKIAKLNLDVPTRKTFLEQASSGLMFFSENAELTSEIIEFILACKNEIDELQVDIERVEEIQLERSWNEHSKEQTNYLLKLTECKTKMNQTKNQDEFRILLEEIKDIEERVNENFLTERDQQLYQELTIEYPNIIERKLTEFERIETTNYNEKAVNDFTHVFSKFKQNEDNYKTNSLALKNLVRTRLFSYDTSQLLDETLIYYNHIYSYIFSKIDEDSKYDLTKLSIERGN